VVCLGKVKIQNVGVFTLDENFGNISVEKAMEMLRQEIM
jgi:hypothetical protein